LETEDDPKRSFGDKEQKKEKKKKRELTSSTKLAIAWSRCRVRTKAKGLLLFTARCVYRRNVPAGTKSTDSASIYGVKMSERFSRPFSLVDGGGYRRETSVRLENCNNNGDFASICPQ
jgi:hypothetical protein